MSRPPFLFGGSSSGQIQSKYLVEFRAGKMTMKGKVVHPDKRKGTVYVHQTDDSLMHFCWKDRTSGIVEDELIVFPDDAEFKRVPQCTTGRVYVLKFKSSSRRCFYWMQEPKTEKDDDYCSKVNEYLNNPPVPGSSHVGGSLGLSGSSGSGLSSLQSDLSNLGDGDLQNLLNNMSQQQLVQLLGGVGGISGVANLSSLLGGSRSSSSTSASSTNAVSSAAPTPPPRSAASETSASDKPAKTTSVATTPTPQPPVTTTAAATPTTPVVVPSTATVTSATQGSSSSQIQLSDLQNILSGLNVPAGQAGSSSAAVDLSTAITAEALAPLLNNTALMERIQSLLPSAPGSPKAGATQVKSTVQSPQFQQALSMFSAALQSGQLGPLMLQFGLGEDVVSAANSGDMDAFVRALQSSQEDSDKKDDEEMSLD